MARFTEEVLEKSRSKAFSGGEGIGKELLLHCAPPLFLSQHLSAEGTEETTSNLKKNDQDAK